MPDAYAIIGLQYGSEAKGALAGYLASEWGPDVCISNWSPNAGHTYIDGNEKIVRRCIPIGTVSKNCHHVLLGPGSIIDPAILQQEMEHLDPGIMVVVHPQAAVVKPNHFELEDKNFGHIGSTKKGAGAAAIERMMRREPAYANTAEHMQEALGNVVVSSRLYHTVIKSASLVQIEGCQGYSLSLYNGFYPYCTSRDTTIHQLKADVAWHNKYPVEVFGCMRTFPIRVAGTSGPCYSDQCELSWDAIGVQPEITTVTKKIRRVFSFSYRQIEEACRVNGPDQLYLSGCDYIEDSDFLAELIDDIRDVSGIRPRWTSYGPKKEDMFDEIQEREESTAN